MKIKTISSMKKDFINGKTKIHRWTKNFIDEKNVNSSMKNRLNRLYNTRKRQKKTSIGTCYSHKDSKMQKVLYYYQE